MKAILILVAGLLLQTSAISQQMAIPRTVPFNDAEGKQIGTVTITGRRMYLRNMEGDLIAQIIVQADGTQTLLDPHGKVLDQLKPKQ